MLQRLLIRQAAYNEELFPGPGHPHVQEPHLLGHFLFHYRFIDPELTKGPCPEIVPRAPVAQADAQVLIQTQLLGGLPVIELLPGPRQDHHRELQSLALVDAHQPDIVLFRSGRLPGRHRRRGFGHPVDEPQEPCQILPGVVLVPLGPSDQIPDVLLPAAAPGEGSGEFVESGFVRHLPAQVFQRQVAGLQAPPVQLRQCLPALPLKGLVLPVLTIGKEAFRKQSFSLVDPHRRQFRSGESENHGPEHAEQGDVLPPIHQ